MSFNNSDKTKAPKVGAKTKVAPKQKQPTDGKDLLEAVGKVQQKRDGLRRKKKKSLLPPQAEKQPGDHDEDDN